MYICKECGQQYKTKPEYCECGNDEFQEPETLKTVAKKNFEKTGVSPFALLFFIICIILSLIILFLFNPKSQNSEIKTPTPIQTKTNIPDIDTLWVEPASKTDTTEIVSKPMVEEKNVQQSKKVNKPTKNTSNVTPKKNNVTTNQNTTTQATPKTATQNKTQENKSQTTPKITTGSATSTVKKTVTNESAKKNNQELYNYKVQLRQALFSKLSVISIQGSGKCGIEFSIDSTGKLINRNFTYQSDNKTVNDEVYKMLMRMPKYYPPPTSYKGEKIKMTFSFNNGSYSINYTN